MAKCIALLLALVLCLASLSYAVPISSRQLLPPKPGYVPVYIRNGDTPLEEINLELAEAFHAIPSGRSAGRSNTQAIKANVEEAPKPAPVKEVSQEVKAAPKKEEPVKAKEELKAKSEEPKGELKAKEPKEESKAKLKEAVVEPKKVQEKVVKLEEKKVPEKAKESKQ